MNSGPTGQLSKILSEDRKTQLGFYLPRVSCSSGYPGTLCGAEAVLPGAGITGLLHHTQLKMKKQSQPGKHGKFQNSQGYMVRSCLKIYRQIRRILGS